MVITCEGKNAQNYVLHNAVRRCASYMLVHLFYWVATKSKLVESVYGVAVAGIKCKDMSPKKGYAVVLMSMSLPSVIGGMLRIKKYAVPLNSLEELWTFTNFVCEKTPGSAPDLLVGGGRPACLQVPLELLRTKPNGWTMVENGTANLVICVDQKQGWTTIGDFFEDPSMERMTEKLHGKQVNYPFYFKSKNYLATDDPQNVMFYISTEGVQLKSFLDVQVYLIPPSATTTGLYILMTRVGTPFRAFHTFPWGLQGFAGAFDSFANRVLACQRESRLVHGDIHMGNLLIDEQHQLRLIDYDEARYNRLTVRTPRPDQDRQRFVYNQALANDFVQFTKNQLLQLFVECWRRVRKVSGEDSVADIRVTTVEGDFHLCFTDGQSPDASAVDDLFDRFREVLRDISTGKLNANTSVLSENKGGHAPAAASSPNARTLESKEKNDRNRKKIEEETLSVATNFMYGASLLRGSCRNVFAEY